ncbi:hypothetical protein PAPYR_1658 [Paratrimastix pyriformis]|uniref:TRAF-type domain-containing protein n=1 Tax=Paratrimastix pyriformis TaxID=342808 RepID=A0ABQ8UW35_9EUKA|nr:hypothetical protein PAPYR_1658 [Paratrimastix pyriformis]
MLVGVPDEGFPTEIFDHTVPGVMLCPICQGLLPCVIALAHLIRKFNGKLGVMRQAVTFICQGSHKACEACCKRWVKEKTPATCPCCRQQLVEPRFNRDPFFNALIQQLPVHCTQAHLATVCPAVEVPCPDCRQLFPRSTIDAHRAQCPEVSIPCPIQGCGAQVARCRMDGHLATAAPQHVACLSREQAATKAALDACWADLAAAKSEDAAARKRLEDELAQSKAESHAAQQRLQGEVDALKEQFQRLMQVGFLRLLYLFYSIRSPSPVLLVFIASMRLLSSRCLQHVQGAQIHGDAVPAVPQLARTSSPLRLPSRRPPRSPPARHPICFSDTLKSPAISVTEGGRVATVTTGDRCHLVLMSDEVITHGVLDVTVITGGRTGGTCYSLGCLAGPRPPTQWESPFGYGSSSSSLLGWGLHSAGERDDDMGVFSLGRLVAPSTQGYKSGDRVRMRIDIDRGDLQFWVNGDPCAELHGVTAIRDNGIFPAATIYNKDAIWSMV